MSRIFLLLCFLTAGNLYAQINVRAWYADGQVWIVWNVQLPIPETVGVYASEESFTDTDNATLIGRPFHLEYLPVALKEQVDTAATYRIPDGEGGLYQLGPAEALFVYTPHVSGNMYFAVTAWGDDIIDPVQITDDQVAFSFDPQNDPVECHLQAAFPSPFAPVGFRCLAYYMWVDGRDDMQSRPDFPVTANTAKNGMPGFFMVSVPIDLDTTQPFPLSVWLHGGGGSARQSLAGSRRPVNINPEHGILVAHNDDAFGHRGTTPPVPENPSLHFGWRKNWNPFSSDNIPTSPDTIFNYTQRRYLWIDEWLMRTFNVDPTRVHIHGHSMGSWGATALIKAYPEHYASAVIFNNGFRGPDPGTNIAAMLGEPFEHFPTNLKDRNGNTVHFPYMFDLTTSSSAHRDIPYLQSFHSKNDVGNANYWGVEVVDNYRAADASGHGMLLSWSERGHSIDDGPLYNDHWVNGNEPDQQTVTDNVSWAEEHYRSDISYPAFFNHRLDPNANDPGDGTPGTGSNGVGDDWGTWGGWHRWDQENIIDEENFWTVEAWLESNAVYTNDNVPHTSLTADLAIRRPVAFNPPTGTILYWYAVDNFNGGLLQTDTTTVRADNLVIIPGIVLYPENTKRVRIAVSTEPVSVQKEEKLPSIALFPNPSYGDLNLRLEMQHSGECTINIYSFEHKKVFSRNIFLDEGQHDVALAIGNALPQGIYVVEVQMSSVIDKMLLVKR